MDSPYNPETYQRDKERIKAAVKKYRDKKPPRLRAYLETNKEKRAATSKAWREANPERMKYLYRRANYAKKYGISPEEFDSMLAAQDGKCAICGTDKPKGRGRFHVDHHHGTGKVRALLCGDCNIGLGMFKESPNLLMAATSYLEAHTQR